MSMLKIERAQKMNLRSQKKEEKLKRIEDAARKLFSARGFADTKTRDIASEAGIGAGTLFVYFPQKRDLLIHLFVKDISEVWTQAVASVDRSAPLVDALMHVFGALYDHYETDRRLSRVFVQELLFVDPREPDPQLAAMTLDFVGELGRLVSEAKERGELGAEVAEPEAAYHFFGAYVFNLVGWLGGMMPAPHHRVMLRRGLELHVAGMRATAKQGGSDDEKT